jgi:RNA polymerase sigma-70 factor (ECF subfamily)
MTWGGVSPVLKAEVTGSPEGALLARARAGDVEALRALYEQHAPAVRRFLEGLLGDRVAADDATQETFARAFRRLAAPGELDRLAPWLFGIARNVACEVRRGRRRDARAPGGPAAGGGAGGAGGGGAAATLARTPEDELLGRETARALGRALERLNDDRRAALLLRVDHELAYDEIARLMGWSLAKVKVEIHRARLALRSHLLGDEGGEERDGGP